MPQLVLDHAGRGAYVLQPRAVRTPQRVPTYVADPRCRSGRFQETVADIGPAEACADRTRENEIVSTHCLACLPLQEHTDEELRHRENAHARCSFWRPNLSLVPHLANDERLPLPIDLPPAQRPYLAAPDSGPDDAVNRRTTCFAGISHARVRL